MDNGVDVPGGGGGGGEVPVVSLSTDDGEESLQCTVQFQCGLLREEETFYGYDVEILCHDSLLEYVCDMLSFKYPDHPYGDLYEKVILLRHDKVSDDLFPLSNDDPIPDGTLIEIILTAEAKQVYSESICPHILSVHTYKAPTFCNHCGVVMFGILKQGLKCEGCDKNFHKGCAYKVPNDCTRHWGELPTGSTSSSSLQRNSLTRNSTSRNSITQATKDRNGTGGRGGERKETWSGRPLWIDKALHNRPQVPHTFYVQSFKKPTACHHCKKLIKGVFRNGMKCKDCQFSCHKKCVKEVGNNCPGEVPSLSRIDNGEYTHSKNTIIANEQDNGSSLPSPPPSSHSIKDPSAAAPSTGEEPKGGEDTSPSSSISSSQEQLETGNLAPGMDTITEEPSGGEDTVSNEDTEHNPAENALSANITLQRVTGVSMRHTKPPSATVLMEGWMVHYTNKSTLRKKHYWRLDTKSLTLYKDSDSPHYYREIELADIMAVDPMVNHALYPLTPPHVFEIVTSACTYYVGVDMRGADPEELTPPKEVEAIGANILGNVSHMTLSQLEDIGVGLDVALSWEEGLHNALMPITPQASMGSLADSVPGAGLVRPSSFRSKRGSLRGSFRGSATTNRSSFRGGTRPRRGSTKAGSFRGSFRAVKQNVPPTVPARAAMKPKIETRMDVSQVYQIFPEEILGSGQFGTVFGGQNRSTGKKVAVKVIDKLRFPHKQDTALRQEVTILQFLEHPGIIFLEQMFETPEKIYIAMEKMNGDMLEMILNSPCSKLTERVTKFLVYQILSALQYLHKKDIVHCDLKPENVLLTSESGMPQAKLCDFGFARIIGEKSFRKSIVGTPAYLAPEVLKNEGYNRSLDLWSVGVIIYVSLSGTFPFNEDEEISDQIQNAAFMYPPDPWATISHEAVDLVSKLLQMNRRSRFKTAQAIHHVWLRDIQLWEDLCELECNLDNRYLTHESEDTWWIQQGAKPHPLVVKKEKKYSHHVYKNIVILDDPHHHPGAPSIATTAAIARPKGDRNINTQDIPPPPPSNPPPPSSAANTNEHTNGSSNSVKESGSEGANKDGSGGNKKPELTKMLSEVEAHAQRVGYTVSTV